MRMKFNLPLFFFNTVLRVPKNIFHFCMHEAAFYYFACIPCTFVPGSLCSSLHQFRSMHISTLFDTTSIFEEFNVFDSIPDAAFVFCTDLPFDNRQYMFFPRAFCCLTFKNFGPWTVVACRCCTCPNHPSDYPFCLPFSDPFIS